MVTSCPSREIGARLLKGGNVNDEKSESFTMVRLKQI